MATIITVASGNVGVGKSVVVSNLGVLLAREGRRVVLVEPSLAFMIREG